jgi:hypothetical protein
VLQNIDEDNINLYPSSLDLTKEFFYQHLDISTAGLYYRYKEKCKSTLYAIEPVLGMLEQTIYKSSEIHLFNVIGENLPTRDVVFNCIFSSQVLHDKENKEAAAYDCDSMLRQVAYTVRNCLKCANHNLYLV